MKFIEISEGLSVAIDKISIIQDSNVTGGAIVHVDNKEYVSTFPYMLLLQLIHDVEEKYDTPKVSEAQEAYFRQATTPAW